MTHEHLTHAPLARRRPITRTRHGEDVVDDYEWLRDKDDPAVLEHLEAENAWTEQQTAHLAGLRQAIYDDIAARTLQTDLSVPSYRVHHDPGAAGDDPGRAYWYYVRTREGSEYAIYCRTPAADPAAPPDLTDPTTLADEEVLLDGNAEAEGTDFFSIGGFAVSPDGRRLAYATDLAGDERFTLRVRDLATGAQLGDAIPDIGYGLTWAGPDHLVFARNDDSWRSHQVLRHRLGEPADASVIVWQEPDERFSLFLFPSADRRWIVLAAASTLTTEYRLLAVDDPESAPVLVAAREQGVEYHVEPAGDQLLITHNANGPDFELAVAPTRAPDRSSWSAVIPHRPGVRINGVDAYAGHAVVSLRRDGLTALHVLPRTNDGFSVGADITFTEPVYTVDNLGWGEYVTDRIRIGYTSLVTPDTISDYVLDTGETITRKVTPVLDHPDHGPYEPGDYVQRREWAVADDGTRVPISLVFHHDTPLDGTAPALLYGYGSYESSTDPSFRIPRLSLLDRGFVYAIAHVRGGGELGRNWYEQGKLLAKRNTFTDFVAAARHLVDRRYTSAARLAAQGGSAGGLLVGAATNLAPDAFRAVHAAVPFVDALTTILMPELPLTVGEWEEWGNPVEDAEVYRYMRSYTPYENVAARPYPAILATTSLNDTRVLYVEPAKWIARLRERTAGVQPDERPILLKTELVAGHGGVSGRYQKWRETAFEYAWLIDQVTR